MHSKFERPFGVTLIAIGILWIGCLGTLLFPFTCLTGGLSALWSLVLGSTSHSQPWFKAISYVLDGVLFLFYVSYAVIGFGLWKLKNWARKGVLCIATLGAVGALIVSLVFVRPLALGISVIGLAVIEFGGLGWYFMRPRVQYAFGAWRRYSSAGEWIEPPGLSRQGKLGIGALAAASLVVLFVIPLYFGIEEIMRSSDAYRLMVDMARASPCVTAVLGSQLEPGWAMQGNIHESSVEGSADLSIPVKGPKGKGDLEVQATKLKGGWRIDSLVFAHDSIRSNIVPSESNQACR
jgi:hypothetical protein